MGTLKEQLSRINVDSLGQETPSSESFQALGHTWVSISQAILSSYVPNLDIDPYKVFRCEDDFRGAQSAWLRGQVEMHSSLENLRTGKKSNSLILLLSSRLSEISLKATSTLPIGCIRNSSILESFWREIRSFILDIFGSGRIQKFFVALACSSSEVRPLEHLLQDSISNFLRRMKTNYVECLDLMPAVELSLLSLRFGLRIAAHSARLHPNASKLNPVLNIVGFNIPVAIKTLRDTGAAQIVAGNFTTGDALFLKLLGLLRDHSRHASQRIGEVNEVYSKLMILWDRDEKEEADRIKESESLYRSKADHELDVSTEEEDEIRRLFPTYGGDDATVDAERHVPDLSRRISLTHQGLAGQVVAIHMDAFGSESNTLAVESMWYSTQRRLLLAMMNEHFESLPMELDHESLAFRIRLLHGMNHGRAHTNHEDYNFYRDSNHSESRKAWDAVVALRSDLSKLIEEWPEQMVLQHLRDRCDMVLSLRSSSPLAMILGALERLLLQTEDWELYANRNNTLKDHRQRIGDLILAWRHLELTSWKNLLDAETSTFCSELSRWWFRLYDILIRGILSLDTTQKVEVTNYVESLTPLVEEFLTSAPSGQYRERISLLKSFAIFTHELSLSTDVNSTSVAQALLRVQAILTSICHYYEQFSPKISSSVSDQRLAIEKEIRGLMQVTTWRDTNVHALQQNAQRMHKQLYRRIRKFRAVLREPVFSQLQHFVGATLDDPSTAPAPSRRCPVDDSWVPTELSAKLRKFSSVFEQKPALRQNSSLSIEEFSGRIMTGTDELSKAIPPVGISSDQQRRWYASLLSQKRRMWNDTVKEFKVIGLTPHLKPEIVDQHRKRAFLMEQPPMPSDGEIPKEVTNKIDSYLYRSIGVFTVLLQSCAEHHPDISTRDLQRGISSFEHGLSIAIRARSL